MQIFGKLHHFMSFLHPTKKLEMKWGHILLKHAVEKTKCQLLTSTETIHLKCSEKSNVRGRAKSKANMWKVAPPYDHVCVIL